MALVKSSDFHRIAALDPAVRLYLIAGPDDASVATEAARILALAGADCERIDLGGPQLKDDPSLLAAEAASLSLFAARRIIRVDVAGAGDEVTAAVAGLMAAPTVVNPVIIAAPGATGRGALMKLAAGDPQAIAVQCYQPDRRELMAITAAAATEQGLRLANAEAQAIIDLVSGDQTLIRRELEKLALYLDAAPDRQRQVSPADIAALGAASHDEDVSAFINAALGGKTAELPAMLATAAAVGVAEIRLLRAFSIRVMLLARLRGEVDRGQHPRTLVADKRHGVFWKERDAVAAQLHIWDSVRIARLMTRLLACERALKASGSAGGVLFRRLVTDMTVQASRAR